MQHPRAGRGLRRADLSGAAQPQKRLGATAAALLLCVASHPGCGVDAIPHPGVALPGSSPPSESSGGDQGKSQGGTGGDDHGSGGSGGGGGSTAASTGGSNGDPRMTGGQGGASESAGGAGGQQGAAGAGGSGGNGATTIPGEDAGAGVTISGHFVPKSKAVVFIHVGHSNMAGRATGPADLHGYFYDTDPRLWAYAKTSGFRPAKEPLCPDMDTGMAAGPGMAILHAAAAVSSPDTMIISIGNGHSGSYEGNCATFRKNGPFYSVAMSSAIDLKGKVTYGGIFTMFGQSEHHVTAAQQHAFADCMKGMADEMRADLGEPELPFMVGDYEAGITKAGIEPSSPFGQLIIGQLKTIPDKVMRAAVIPTDGLPMEDDHHFNMAGHKMWADRGLGIMVMKGWTAPWGLPK